MTVLFVVMPVVVILLGWFRPHPGFLHCGSMLFLAGLSGLNLCQTLAGGSPRGVTLWGNFLTVGTHRVDLGVYLDFYSSYMVWVVFTVSALVHLYSTVYMGGDPRLHLFLSYLTLFTFFMVTLLVAPNYVQLFMGWEGVGLTSYLLVNFWHTRTLANKSALKALVVNRVGDFFLLYTLLALAGGGTLSFFDLDQPTPLGVSSFVVVAAAAKSAQLGLHTWLPDAMEGPTPVSALIHAATMVTAGVFLLYRSPHLVENLRGGILLLGSTTAFFAGTVAAFQYDLKRVIAYSTCSQLGFMVVAFSLDAPELSLYHLANHAFFKALLFLLAGLVIHSLADEQDMRRMGGLLNSLPLTYVLFVVGSFALAGVPFLSGWYSKDAILEVLSGKSHHYAYGACLAGAYLTAYYSFRTVWLVFFGTPRGNRSVYLNVTEADPLSLGVVTFLGGLSLFHGFLLRETFLGWGRTEGWTTPLLEAEFGVSLWIKLLPLFLSLGGAGLCVWVESTGVTPPRGVVLFLSKRWWWDLLDSTLSRRFMIKGYTLYLVVERGFFEWVGPTGVTRILSRGYDSFRNRGWLSGLWLSGLGGFVFLVLVVSFSVSPEGEILPYVPFVAFAGGRYRVS